MTDEKTGAAGSGHRDDGDIKAIPLRHPGRWVAAAIVAFLLVCFVYSATQNTSYGWDVYAKYLFDQRISSGALWTIFITVVSMVLGIVMGVLAAVMRMSENFVLRYVAWLYIWIFRGTPVYIQLVLWGLVPSLYQTIGLSIPGLGMVVGLPETETWMAPVTMAILGLGLNEGAYMSEIVRAGIQSVDEGQREAAIALGMSRRKMLRRIVMPQAMRVIIPPTGNELIGMLKTTSLVIAIPVAAEMFKRTQDIAGLTYDPIPLYLVACTWYLLFTSILMIGQHFLERHYSRGASRLMSGKQLEALAEAQGRPTTARGDE